DHQANALLRGIAGGDPAADIPALTAFEVVYTTYGDPLAQPGADHGVGTLNVDNTAAGGALAIMVGTQIDGGRVSVQTHSGVEARGHVVILRLLYDLTVDTGRGGGQGDALTRLDQHRIPLVGHYDPYPVVSMAGFAAYDAGLVAAPRLAHDDIPGAGASLPRVVLAGAGASATVGMVSLRAGGTGAGIADADAQPCRPAIEVAEQGADFLQTLGLGADDQLIAVGRGPLVRMQQRLQG